MEKVSYLRLPPLARTHPNFFVLFTATGVFHAYEAWVSLDRNAYSSPAFNRLNDLVPPQMWATVHILIVVLMVIGLHRRTFSVARLALALGTAIALFHGLMIGFTWALDDYGPAKVGVGFRFLTAMVHYTQTVEPPRNPETAR